MNEKNKSALKKIGLSAILGCSILFADAVMPSMSFGGDWFGDGVKRAKDNTGNDFGIGDVIDGMKQLSKEAANSGVDKAKATMASLSGSGQMSYETLFGNPALQTNVIYGASTQPFPSSAVMLQAFTALDNTLSGKMSQTSAAQSKRDMAAQKLQGKLTQGHAESMAEIQKASDLLKHDMEVIKSNVQGTSATGGCQTDVAFSNALRNGGGNKKKLSGSVGRMLEEVSEGTQKDEVKARQVVLQAAYDFMKDRQTLSSEDMFPQEGVYTQDGVSKAAVMMQLSLDTNPNPMIQDVQSAAGRRAMEEQAIKKARMAPSVKIHQENLANQSPVYSAAALQAMMENMNKMLGDIGVSVSKNASTNGDVPTSATQKQTREAIEQSVENKKLTNKENAQASNQETSWLSTMRYLLSDLRLHNSNYYSIMSAGNEERILREIAILELLRANIELASFEYTMQQSAAIANMNAMMVEQYSNQRIQNSAYATGKSPVVGGADSASGDKGEQP